MYLPESVRLEKFFSKYWLFDEAWRNSHKSAAVGGGDAGEHCDALETGLRLKLVLDVGVSISRSFCLKKYFNVIEIKKNNRTRRMYMYMYMLDAGLRIYYKKYVFNYYVTDNDKHVLGILHLFQSWRQNNTMTRLTSEGRQQLPLELMNL